MATSRSVLALLIATPALLLAAALPVQAQGAQGAQEPPKADSAPAKVDPGTGGAEAPPKPDGPPPGPGEPRRERRGDGPPWGKPDGPPPDGKEGGKRDGKPDWGHRGPPPFAKLTPEEEADKMRAMAELQKLTPEDRAKIWKALMAVMNLPEDQRSRLINTEEERRAKVREEIDKTIKEIGVTIPDDRRRKFFRSFFEGRRKIEETLRTEGDQRRAVLVQELHEKLKKEFGTEAVQADSKVEQK